MGVGLMLFCQFEPGVFLSGYGWHPANMGVRLYLLLDIDCIDTISININKYLFNVYVLPLFKYFENHPYFLNLFIVFGGSKRSKLPNTYS